MPPKRKGWVVRVPRTGLRGNPGWIDIYGYPSSDKSRRYTFRDIKDELAAAARQGGGAKVCPV